MWMFEKPLRFRLHTCILAIGVSRAQAFLAFHTFSRQNQTAVKKVRPQKITCRMKVWEKG